NHCSDTVNTAQAECVEDDADLQHRHRRSEEGKNVPHCDKVPARTAPSVCLFVFVCSGGVRERRRAGGALRASEESYQDSMMKTHV
ncbi:MAG: hypothetical protein ACPIOQ_28635, partial [Promethearchaeia archaeon]